MFVLEVWMKVAQTRGNGVGRTLAGPGGVCVRWRVSGVGVKGVFLESGGGAVGKDGRGCFRAGSAERSWGEGRRRASVFVKGNQ